ncbi:MAG TPA: M67 family metallopeptidase [Solirubrobacteraceae bacterium]|nr:M67 family metallopeptidase [Solirubrobacteraceae bacterium]
MRISQALYDELVAHARAEAPNECCGMVATRGEEAVAVHRAENIHHSPMRYEMDGKEQLRLYLAIEDAGLELGAIYHSHTRSEPYPSQTDVNLAVNWPDPVYIIIGLASGPEAKVRAYTIRDEQITEVPLLVG